MIETLLPAYSDVLQAAARIAPHTAPTPLLRSHTLDTLSGAQLMFKAEHLQRSGAFKFAAPAMRSGRCRPRPPHMAW